MPEAGRDLSKAAGLPHARPGIGTRTSARAVATAAASGSGSANATSAGSETPGNWEGGFGFGPPRGGQTGP